MGAKRSRHTGCGRKNWVNSEIVGESTSLVTITGSFIEQGGTITTFDGPGTITGMLDNQGGQIMVSGHQSVDFGRWNILGGTVFATNGAAMVVNTLGNALDGVTFNGTLDINDTFDQAALEVTNGLTLEGDDADETNRPIPGMGSSILPGLNFFG